VYALADDPGERPGSRAVAAPPLVTAILPVSDAAHRLRTARKAVTHFLQQTYAAKELVIANNSGTPVLERPEPGVREFGGDYLPAGMTAGQLRNFALMQARGDWVVPWDDDDAYHPFLLSYFMAERVEGRALLLSTQVRCDLTRSSAFLHHDPQGIATALCYPREPELRYPARSEAPAQEFWLDHFAARSHVCENPLYPASVLWCALYHGRNLQPRDLFTLGRGPESGGCFDLPPIESRYLTEVLRSYGFDVAAQRSAAGDPFPLTGSHHHDDDPHEADPRAGRPGGGPPVQFRGRG
jgi:hypothetical protein